MNTELVRIVDAISRDKNIEKESVFCRLEEAMVSAVRKQHDINDDVVVTIDRVSGEMAATRNGESIEMKTLGRIAAQTAKQVMIQKIREDERESLFEEYEQRRFTVVTGTVSQFVGGALLVNMGRTEGFLPKSEQIPGETHHPGERIRCLILDVREAPHQVKIVLSRSHPELIRRLFELEVPEVAERIIEIKALAREAGYRTKVAVSSIDTKVDAVGACVGVRGSRIKNIVVELGGEKIDIVRWNESSQILIQNSLKPAEVIETALCFELGRATVVVEEDQLSLAIGKRGQNVRLAARLTGWDIDILTPAEFNKGLDDLEKELTQIEGIEGAIIEKMVAVGIISLMDVEEVGLSTLVSDLELEETLAEQVVAHASEAAKRIAAETAAAKVAAKEAEEAAAAAAAEAAATEAEEGATEGEDGASEVMSASEEPSEGDAGVEAAVDTEAGDAVETDEGETDGGEPEAAASGAGEDESEPVPATPESVPEAAVDTEAGDAVETDEGETDEGEPEAGAVSEEDETAPAGLESGAGEDESD